MHWRRRGKCCGCRDGVETGFLDHEVARIVHAALYAFFDDFFLLFGVWVTTDISTEDSFLVSLFEI